MRAKPECVSCIFNQALRVCQNLNIDETQTKAVLDAVGERVKDFNLNHSPPMIAKWVYALIAQILDKKDLYKKAKNEASIHAQIALQNVKAIEHTYDEKLLFALKCSVAGNVIDLAAQQEYNLQEELKGIFDTKFAIDDFLSFKDKFTNADSVLVIGDNAGEHIFDNYMLEIFKSIDPKKQYYFGTRNNPIINDLTYKEAQNSELMQTCNVINSGVDTPGMEMHEADDAFLELLSSVDIVIAKGMGNYESLSYKAGREVFHLFKVKCNVVAQDLKKPIGSIIFAKL